MALDYFQILLLYPTERLPVFAAFSPENTTGKSTLANLVIQIFGDNAVSVNAAEFQDKFNDSISSRLLVICDETLIDNDAGMDRLKNLVTAKQVLVNPKGLAKYTIDHFAKYWMFSNRPNMLKVVKYDERFWFRRISAIPKGDQIPDMEQLMASEIPAFLHFLRNRKLVTTTKSRLRFDVSLYTSANPTFADMVEKNEPRDVRQLRHALESIFEESEDDAIFFSREDVKTEIFSGKIDLGRVKDILQDYLGLKPLEKQRYKYPRRTLIAKREDADSGLEETMSIQWIRAQGRPYQFDRKLFENGG
ncbi:MAG: hypothetical protein IPH16_16175 [Haliscomenobacter sp.]|nr:hypothetical protein [Haliscomenobacter sp.]